MGSPGNAPHVRLPEQELLVLRTTVLSRPRKRQRVLCAGGKVTVPVTEVLVFRLLVVS